jgi:hypothetical protein
VRSMQNSKERTLHWMLKGLKLQRSAGWWGSSNINLKKRKQHFCYSEEELGVMEWEDKEYTQGKEKIEGVPKTLQLKDCVIQNLENGQRSIQKWRYGLGLRNYVLCSKLHSRQIEIWLGTCSSSGKRSLSSK